MAYVVLARKWRPQTFSDLVGQEHVSRTLGRAIETGRVAHAYLFTGTRGVGKTTTARILSMALNCDKAPTPEPCGVCPSCRDVRSGGGLDVLEIDGASNNSVEDVRKLREQIDFAPAGGKYRIVIIDEVHMLSKAAFNALLKTLEEPPPHFIFIFATTDAHKVPETILSRVQRHDFKRITPDDIFRRLETVCDAEKIAWDEPALRLLSRRANGSMRDALTLLDQAIPYCKEKLTVDGLRGALGLAGAELFFELTEFILDRNEAGLIDRVARAFDQGFDLLEFVEGLEEHVRGLLFAGLKGLDPAVLALSEKERADNARQATRTTPADLLRMVEILSGLAFRLERSPMPRFEIETALLKLARLDASVDIAAFLRSGASAQTPVPVSPTPPPPPATTAIVPPSNRAPQIPDEPEAPLPPAGDLSNLQGQWKSHIQSLSQTSMQAGLYLAYSFVLSSTPQEIRIGFPDSQKFQYEQASKPDNEKTLLEYFRSLGFAGKLAFELVTEDRSRNSATPAAPLYKKKETATASMPRENINDAIKKEPILGKLLDVFDGEVV